MRLRSRKQPGLRGEQQRPSRSRPARSASFSAWCQVCAQGVLLCVHGRNTERICHQNYPPSTHDIVLRKNPVVLAASRLTVRPALLAPVASALCSLSHSLSHHRSAHRQRSLTPPRANPHSLKPEASRLRKPEEILHHPSGKPQSASLSVAPGHPSEHISPRQPAKAHRPPLHHRPNHPAPLRHRSRSPRLICPRPPLLCLSCRRAAAGWRPGGR